MGAEVSRGKLPQSTNAQVISTKEQRGDNNIKCLRDTGVIVSRMTGNPSLQLARESVLL